MKIGIFGAGRMGGNLAKAWTRTGHKLTMGVRDMESSNVESLRRDVSATVYFGSFEDALNFGDVVVMAIPFHAVETVLNDLPEPGRKIIVDCTNPVEWQGGPVFAPGYNISATLQLVWPEARIVKAFNTLESSQVLSPEVAGEPIDMYYCSDDPEAGEVVARLATDIGLHPINTGRLENAPLIENISILLMMYSSTSLMGHSLTMKLLYD